MQKDLALELHLAEDDVNTVVHAVLNLRGDHFEAVGRARRREGDPMVPLIGEELAIARALHDITSQVMEAAQHKIETQLTP